MSAAQSGIYLGASLVAFVCTFAGGMSISLEGPKWFSRTLVAIGVAFGAPLLIRLWIALVLG